MNIARFNRIYEALSGSTGIRESEKPQKVTLSQLISGGGK